MKNSLFEILMTFFERSLSQITKNQSSTQSNDEGGLNQIISYTINQDGEEFNEEREHATQSLVVRTAHETSIRVFTDKEQIKFTKSSYQFLIRLLLWEVISSESMELIINQLLLSESRYVTLQETKWTIRNVLAENLEPVQLAFLDLVLYQKEDGLSLH